MFPQLSAGAMVPWVLLLSRARVAVLFISFYTSLSLLSSLSLPSPSSPTPPTSLSAFSVYSVSSLTFPFALSPFSFLLFDFSRGTTFSSFNFAACLSSLSSLFSDFRGWPKQQEAHRVRPWSQTWHFACHLNVSLWVFWPSFVS